MIQMTFQRVCAWSGVICVVLFFGAFALAGFIPPLSPSLPAEQVAAHYRDNTTGIRIGMDLMLLSGAFYAMFTAVMSGQMRRIPGVSPTMVYTQLGAGSFACLTFLMPAIFFLAASFRPERSPELTQILNDMAWIMMVIPWMPFMAQNFAFAFAILSDTRPYPLFPRWVGFLNIWAPISFTPSVLLPFFKSGPFAWSGIFVIWIPAFIFIFWFAVVTRMLLKAIDREERERQESPAN